MHQRPTLEDVAERAGVSRALVSIVMRDAPGASAATRERVRQAADAIGYRPDPRARRLRLHRTKLLGVVFTAGQEFHAGLVDGMYRAADALGYDVVLSCVTPSRDEHRAVRTLIDDRCEALLLIGSQLPAKDIADLGDGMPVVAVARRVRGVDAVRSDDTAGAALAVAHLCGLGHRAVTYLEGGRAAGAAERRRGYRKTAAAAGIRQAVLAGGVTEREGGKAAAALLESGDPLPTAIFAFNDRCALGVLDVLIRAGVLVPEEVSVVGFDDSPLAGLAHVDLTTVGQDSLGLAEMAVQRVAARLEDPAVVWPAADLVREPKLVVRGSTAPPRL